MILYISIHRKSAGILDVSLTREICLMEWAITSSTYVLKHNRIACYCYQILTTDMNMLMKGTNKEPTHNLEKTSNTKAVTNPPPSTVIRIGNDCRQRLFTQKNVFWIGR